MRLVKYLKERFQYGIIVSCIAFSHNIFSEVIIIPPSENSQERLQEALILVNPGDVIQLTSGVYDLEDGLSLDVDDIIICLLYTSPSPRDRTRSRMPSSA